MPIAWTKSTSTRNTIVFREIVEGTTLRVVITSDSTLPRGSQMQPRMTVEPEAGWTRAQSAWFARAITEAWETWVKEFSS